MQTAAVAVDRNRKCCGCGCGCGPLRLSFEPQLGVWDILYIRPNIEVIPLNGPPEEKQL